MDAKYHFVAELRCFSLFFFINIYTGCILTLSWVYFLVDGIFDFFFHALSLLWMSCGFLVGTTISNLRMYHAVDGIGWWLYDL